MKTVCYESYTFLEALKLFWWQYLIVLIVAIIIYVLIRKLDKGCYG